MQNFKTENYYAGIMNQAFVLIWDGDRNIMFWMKERLILKNKLKPPLPRQNTEWVERNCKSTCFFMGNKHWLCFKTSGRWDFPFPGVSVLWSEMTTVQAAISKERIRSREKPASPFVAIDVFVFFCFLFLIIKCRSNNTYNSWLDSNNM